MKIVAVGDIMPGGILNIKKNEFISDELRCILQQGDIRVGTLETAVGNRPEFNEEKMRRKADVIYVRDEDLVRLKDLDINIVSLANNHFTDLGEIGAKHTIRLLDEMGILHCGAGDNIESASKPAVISKNGKTYAFLAFCDWRDETVGWCPFATNNSYGVNPMTDEYVVSEIQKYKLQYDYIVVIPHWGMEYIIPPSLNAYRMAQKMIEAGADIILGGHTHCIQPIWKYRNRPVVFSMGNFLFPDRLLNTPRSTYYPDGDINIEELPVTYGYPKYVDCITFKKWNMMARYGLIVTIDLLDNSYSVSTNVSYLSDDNYLTLFNEQIYYHKNIRRASKALNTGFYPLIYTTITNLLKLKNHTKNLLKL